MNVVLGGLQSVSTIEGNTYNREEWHHGCNQEALHARYTLVIGKWMLDGWVGKRKLAMERFGMFGNSKKVDKEQYGQHPVGKVPLENLTSDKQGKHHLCLTVRKCRVEWAADFGVVASRTIADIPSYAHNSLNAR